MKTRPLILLLFPFLFSSWALAEDIHDMSSISQTQNRLSTQGSQAFKKAERDARRMMNWWKHKLKKDADFQEVSIPSVAPAVRSVSRSQPQFSDPSLARLPQYSVEETPRKDKK